MEEQTAREIVDGVMLQFSRTVLMWGREVPAMPIAEDLFIAVERWQRDNESRIAELHIVNGSGKWGGPGVTIYPADLDIGILRNDDAEPEDFIEPAYCSASSSITKSTAQTRAQARMIMLAADLADAYTELDRTALVKRAQELKEQVARDAERSRKRRRERAALMADVERYVNTDVRITIGGRRTAPSGRLTEVTTNGLMTLRTAYSDKPVEIMINDVTKLEWKNPKNRYENTGLIK